MAGTVKFREEFFFSAKFTGMGNKRAAGSARGMLDVEHLVKEHVFHDEFWNGRVIHSAVQKDLIGAGIIAAELTAPGASAPAKMRASKNAAKELSV